MKIIVFEKIVFTDLPNDKMLFEGGPTNPENKNYKIFLLVRIAVWQVRGMIEFTSRCKLQIELNLYQKRLCEDIESIKDVLPATAGCILIYSFI